MAGQTKGPETPLASNGATATRYVINDLIYARTAHNPAAASP